MFSGKNRRAELRSQLAYGFADEENVRTLMLTAYLFSQTSSICLQIFCCQEEMFWRSGSPFTRFYISLANSLLSHSRISAPATETSLHH